MRGCGCLDLNQGPSPDGDWVRPSRLPQQGDTRTPMETWAFREHRAGWAVWNREWATGANGMNSIPRCRCARLTSANGVGKGLTEAGEAPLLIVSGELYSCLSPAGNYAQCRRRYDHCGQRDYRLRMFFRLTVNDPQWKVGQGCIYADCQRYS